MDRRRLAWAGGALVALVTMIRGAFLWETPVHTGDILRHILYGRLVLDHGLAAAARPLGEFGVNFDPVPFWQLPYNYPIVALLYFTAVSAVSPTLFFARLSLTLVEALNAWLLARVTGDPWSGILYWCLPVSLWWVSREGQFEPVQSAFVLLALAALPHRPALAAALLGVAIQVKVTAAVMLPYVLLTMPRDRLPKALLALAATFLLTLATLPWYPSVQNVVTHSAQIRLNLIYWNPLADLAMWAPWWLRTLSQLASWAMLLLLGFHGARSTDKVAWLAPLALLAVLKLHTNVPPWYFLLLPPVLAPIPDARLRRVLIALTALLAVDAALDTVGLPVAPRGAQGAFEALDPFARLRAPGS